MLPALLAKRLADNRITTGERLVELAIDLPGALAKVLGWSIGDVTAAREGLAEALRGHVDSSALLEPSERFERGFGAIAPSATSGNRGR